MKTMTAPSLGTLLLTTSLFAEQNCPCGPHPAVATVSAETKDAPKRHPLKGIVIDVLADKSALLVKHEEIPGVMKAMTMLLKVDADTLKSPAATKGAAITGLLVRKADGWWLEEAKLAE
jgi:hypothetical protein